MDNDLEYIDMMEDELDSEVSPEYETKCILLKDGTYLVSKIQEILADYGMPNCKLITPLQILNDGTKFCTWPKYRDQDEILVSSDSFLTIYDPDAKVLKEYHELV
jgi:hypothetical protein